VEGDGDHHVGRRSKEQGRPIMRASRAWSVLSVLSLMLSCSHPGSSHAVESGRPVATAGGAGWIQVFNPARLVVPRGRRCMGVRGMCGQAIDDLVLRNSDDLKPSTIDWLLEKTKGRGAQFDIILETSKDRLNLQSQLSDLKSKVCAPPPLEIACLSCACPTCTCTVNVFPQIGWDIAMREAAHAPYGRCPGHIVAIKFIGS
jgi:hypothetical protein